MARTHRTSSNTEDSLPRYFGKHGLANEDPNRVKKAGAGRLNWGKETDDIADIQNSGDFNFFRVHRRSNSSIGSRNFASNSEWRDEDSRSLQPGLVTAGPRRDFGLLWRFASFSRTSHVSFSGTELFRALTSSDGTVKYNNKLTARSPSPLEPDRAHGDHEPRRIEPLRKHPDLPEGFSYYHSYPYTQYGYTYCQALQTEELQTTGYMPIDRPACASVSLFDRSEDCAIDIDNNRVFGSDKEFYNGARANICIPDGRWFFEVEVVKANDHENALEQVAVGLTRPDHGLHGPPGCDFSGYGVTTEAGDALVNNLSYPFLRPVRSGDVLGFDVCIPNGLSAPVKFPNFAPLLKHDALMLENLSAKQDKSGKDVQTIYCFPGSYIDVYLNGKLHGQLAGPLADFRGHFVKTELYGTADRGLLGYYPTIECMGGAIAGFRFGPEFNYELPRGSNPLSNRYNVAVADKAAVSVFYEAFSQLRKGLQLTNKGCTVRDKVQSLKTSRTARKGAATASIEPDKAAQDATELEDDQAMKRGRQPFSDPEPSPKRARAAHGPSHVIQW